ncbi:MAG: alpha-hydroxy acid oxidase, partial [Pseudomonadota bacterium]
DLTTKFLGQTYDMPIGIAPIGMSGILWPGGEGMLARAAAKAKIPYVLSTMATVSPEDVGPDLGGMGWFQLYPPGDIDIRKDLLKRMRDCGFHTLVLTIDVSVASRRERQRRAQITQPMRITPRVALSCALSPLWTIAMLKRMRTHGWPRIRTLEKYADVRSDRPGTSHIGYKLRTAPDYDYVRWLRDHWDGPLVLKGVLDETEVPAMLDAGADALWVSNHGGRQYPAAPAAIDALARVRAAVGPDYPLIFDSGVRSGTDILRAIAMGADFVMAGRAWHYGIAALGEAGAGHVAHVLQDSMLSDMGQMAITRPLDARSRIAPVT